MDYSTHYESPLGGMTMASDGESLIGLWFDGQKYFAETRREAWVECAPDGLPIFQRTVQWLDVYFSGKDPDFTPSMRMRTTPFRRAVWEILLSIPYGETMTYGEIARCLGQKKNRLRMGAQAVGGAVGHNAISLLIPCHRVVGADGGLTSYAGGIDKKIQLLALEGIERDGLFLPKIGSNAGRVK